MKNLRRPDGCELDLTITALQEAIGVFKQKSMGVLPVTLLIHPSQLCEAYNICHGVGAAAQLLHIIPVPGWFDEDAWMLVGSEGYILMEGA